MTPTDQPQLFYCESCHEEYPSLEFIGDVCESCWRSIQQAKEEGRIV
jgi:hypothetical protein